MFYIASRQQRAPLSGVTRIQRAATSHSLETTLTLKKKKPNKLYDLCSLAVGLTFLYSLWVRLSAHSCFIFTVLICCVSMCLDVGAHAYTSACMYAPWMALVTVTTL